MNSESKLLIFKATQFDIIQLMSNIFFSFEKPKTYLGSFENAIPGSARHILQCPMGFDVLNQCSLSLQNALLKQGHYKQNWKRSGKKLM